MNYAELPDRELDALCAEKVMGYTRILEPPSQTGFSRVRYERDGVHVERGFAPTLLIRHTFEVVEAMRERGFNYDMGSHEDKHSVGFLWRGEMITLGWHEDKSLPRAICIAALRATDEVSDLESDKWRYARMGSDA